MIWMITKFISCLLAAGALGFIIGWVLSSLIRNEKLEERYNLLKDDYDLQKAEHNQALSDLKQKEDELEHQVKINQQIQKELLIKNMDIEDCQKKNFDPKVKSELELEINMLKEEISEYKYLENENSILHNELKALEEEKEQLLQQLEDEQLSLIPKSVKNQKTKIKSKKIKKHLKIAQEQLKLIKIELNKLKNR